VPQLRRASVRVGKVRVSAGFRISSPSADLSIFVILDPVLNRQPRHADVDARLRDPDLDCNAEQTVLRNHRLEQNYVNAVMEFFSQTLA
jgi:hypothetical protein